MWSIPLTVSMTPTLAERVDQIARTKGLSRSSLARALLQKGLDEIDAHPQQTSSTQLLLTASENRGALEGSGR
jgi:metal-responsive CopG/Arc/MetJ family transcriptional regulator